MATAIEIEPIRSEGSLPKSALTTSRLTGLDSGKFIAAVGVVVIHVAPSTSAGERLGQFFSVFAVSFFLISSLRLFIARQERKTTRIMVESLSQRILLPFLAWTSIHLTLFQMKAILTGQERVIDWMGALVYGASAVHLYFLPLLVSIQICLLSISSLKTTKGYRFQASFVLLMTISVIALGYHQEYLGWELAPIFPLLVAASWFAAKYDEALRTTKPALLFGLVIFGLAVASRQGEMALSRVAIPIDFLLGGMGFYILSLRLPAIAPKWVLSASYGIYLSHFIFIESIEFLMQCCGFTVVEYTLIQKSVLAMVALGCSVTLTLLLRQSPLLARLLLGECSK